MSVTTEPGGPVGVRAAAQALGVSPSTVSRYLQEYPILNLAGDGQRPKVDLDDLRRHRAMTLDPAYRGSHAGLLMGEGDGKPKARAPMDTAEAYRRASATTKAQADRLDLDVKKKLLVPLAEVETGIVNAGSVLLQALLELGSRMADKLSAMQSPNEIALLLESEHRAVLHEFHSALEIMAEKLRAEKPHATKA